MARLISQAKLGYYPTPPEVVDHIRQSLIFEPDVRILDPCCGEGEALAEIARGCTVETYGIELEQDRLNKARQILNHVLWGDALKEVSVSPDFDLLYLNPPYDFEESQGKAGRLEHRFLTRYRRAMAPQGMIIMIFPLSALRSEPFANEVARFSHLEIFTFPEGDLFNRFHQLVLVAWKKMVTDAQFQQHLVTLNDLIKARVEDLPAMFRSTWEMGRYQVRKVHSQNPLELRTRRLDPERLLDLVASSGLWKEFFTQVEPPSMNNVTPLVPMRQGHLAMLVAAGFCNGAEITDAEAGSGAFLVKGIVKRTSNVKSSEKTKTHDVTHVLHTHKIRVRMLRINDAIIEEIE